MVRVFRFLMGSLVVAVIVGLPVGYASYRNSQFRNFSVVKPGALYRSGQMSVSGLERIVHDHGIRTVITLRDAEIEGNRPPDCARRNTARSKTSSMSAFGCGSGPRCMAPGSR